LPGNSSIRSAISICTDRVRISHPADGCAGETGLQAAHNEAEVDDTFEVPLAFLMDPVNHQVHSKEFRGMERSYYAMPFEERYIWGADRGDFCACCMSGSACHDRPCFNRDRNFLIPFAVYALFLIATRSELLIQSSWPVHIIAKLMLGSLLLVVLSFILLAHFSGAPPNSTLHPAHIENGKFRSRS